MNKSLIRFVFACSFFAVVACAPTPEPAEERVYPAPQNLVGSTDELQLVTELSVSLANTYGGDRILVVLEIDDTLLASNGDSVAAPCGADFSMLPVQEDAAQQVKRLQEQGLKVIVLTSRDAACSEQTLATLAQNGFDFSTSAWPPRAGYPEEFKIKGNREKVAYQDGVFFTAGQDKGEMLLGLLEKSGAKKPVIIVATDHEKQSLSAYMKAFSWTATKVHTWHYTRELSNAEVADL